MNKTTPTIDEDTSEQYGKTHGLGTLAINQEPVITVTVTGSRSHIGTTTVAGLIEDFLTGLSSELGEQFPKVRATQRYENEAAGGVQANQWREGGMRALGASIVHVHDGGVTNSRLLFSPKEKVTRGVSEESIQTPGDILESREATLCFFPTNAENYRELTLEERVAILEQMGVYTASRTLADAKNDPGLMGDLQCSLDNQRIPTHVIKDVVVADYIANRQIIKIKD